MSDNTQNTQNAQTDNTSAETTNTETTNQSQQHMIPKSRFDEINQQRKEYERRLQELENQIQQRQQQELETKQEYQELYQQEKERNETLAQYKERYDRERQEATEDNEAIIAALSDEDRELVPDYDDPFKTRRWLQRYQQRASNRKPTPPSTDAGAGNTTSNTSIPANVEAMAAQVQSAYGIELNRERLSQFVKERKNKG